MTATFKEWLFNLGEKTSRTDIWVVLFSLITIASATSFFLCGLNIITPCNPEFISYNVYILITCLGCMTFDLGIKSWNSDNRLKSIIKKVLRVDEQSNNTSL